MAFSYTTDPSGIDYNNLPSSGFAGLAAKLKYDGNDFEYANEDGITPFINAVEINWNGAQVAGKTLNTAGELFSA